MASHKQTRDHIAKLQRFCDQIGVSLKIEKTNGSHHRVVLGKDGEETFIIIPSTTGDKFRGPKAALTEGKRRMREKGWIE